MAIRIIIDYSTGRDVYEDAKIVSGNISLSESISCDTLPYDIMKATVATDDMMPTLLAPADADLMASSDDYLIGLGPYYPMTVKDPQQYEYGAPVRVYHNDRLLAKLYMSEVVKKGPDRYQITCVSAVGLLTKTKHYGGVWPVGASTTFGALLAEIIGSEIEYSLDAGLANETVCGWLPIASRRDNLQQLVFAMSAAVEEDDDGNIRITKHAAEIQKTIPDSRVYVGGEVQLPAEIGYISLSEHTYLEGDTPKRLFSGLIENEAITTPRGEAAAGTIVTFRSPCHDLEVTGAQIIESNCNYAVIGPGEDVTLTGVEYVHTAREIVRSTDTGTGSTKAVTVADATLVSALNSEIIADRLADYYGKARTVKMDILVDGERPGNNIAFVNPFSEQSSGLISGMDITFGGILKAKAQIVTDYTPPAAGNMFNSCRLIEEDCTLPLDHAGRCRLVLIGGGNAGDNGTDGQEGIGYSRAFVYQHWQLNGWQGYAPAIYNGEGGKGGKGGKAGESGKVSIVDFTVEAGDTLQITIGRGGECSSEPGGPGGKGGETKVSNSDTEYSSAAGVTMKRGYTTALLPGRAFSVPAAYDGIDGGDGYRVSASLFTEADVEPEIPPVFGVGGVMHYPGNRSGGEYSIMTRWNYDENRPNGYNIAMRGGGGGASAVGDGHDGEGSGVHDYMGIPVGGNGGDGADGGVSDAGEVPGQGGSGGHGGGGGGGRGAYYSFFCDADDPYDKTKMIMASLSGKYNENGMGGEYGRGGRGADGCVILFY